jgi:hypothetical protein
VLGFTLDTAGSPNSVAVSRGLVAVAGEADLKTDPDSVELYDAGSGRLSTSVTVLPLPLP